MKSRLLVYAGAIIAALVIILGLLQFGARTVAVGVPLSQQAAPSGVIAQILSNAGQPLPRLLLQLLVVMLATRVLGDVMRRLGQPTVIGEILGGLVLGPSLLGWLAPPLAAFVFPAGSLTALQALSQVGVLLFMFGVGLELEPARLRGHAQTAVAVSHFSILVPFTLGVALSLWLYGSYAPSAVPFHAFGLFCGIAMSITAFPVLARILEDRRLTQTPLGATAIACAAVDDVTAWSLLAIVVAITTSGGALGTLIVMLLATTAFVGVMLTWTRRWLRRVLPQNQTADTLTRGQIAGLLGVLLGSSLVTELIGIHGLFGAFVAGTVVPAQPTLSRAIRDRVESVSTVFLLPLFFAYTGLRTQVGLLTTARSWIMCVAIVLVATIGKWGASMLAARWTGLKWRDASALGALMNTRGLMELVALNVGYDLGILSAEIFTMMVIMALVTTAMTGPLLTLSLYGFRRRVDPPRHSVPEAPRSS